MSFKDHFSRHSAAYRQFRPTYPASLYEFLASLAPARKLAWDCATGNGQAAVGLARHFERVIATDASAAQLAERQIDPRVVYACATAEQAPIKSGSCALVTVAQAAHWFNLPAFYAEVERVACPGAANAGAANSGAVIALWTYGRCIVNPGVDQDVADFNREVIGPYWPPERHYVDAGYCTLPFPFKRCAAPPFELAVAWSAEDLVNYIGTWSAVSRYRDAVGSDPLRDLRARLAVSWADGKSRSVRWPLDLIVGRVA